MQDIIGKSYFYATPEAVARSYRAQRQTARMAGKRTPITGINKDFAERWNEAERELIGSPAFPRGHTQVSLGKAIGISGPQVCAARNGDTIPERPTLVAFCRLTGVSMEWLQTGVGPKYPVPDSEFIDIARDLSKLLPEHQRIVTDLIRSFSSATMRNAG